MKIFEKLPTLDKNESLRYKNYEIKYPSLLQQWFYFVSNKNILKLQEMVDNGFDINYIDTNAQTIAHHCIIKKSRKLLAFCIKNKANFNVEDIDNLYPVDLICHFTHKIEFFKAIITTFPIEILLQEKYLNRLHQMVEHDQNLAKIKFIFNFAPQTMAPFKNALIANSKKKNALKVWQYLSGREKLFMTLSETLIVKNNHKSVVKVKI